MTVSELKCSFCGEPESRVDYLVRENDVQICDECVRICAIVINERHAERLQELNMQLSEAHPS